MNSVKHVHSILWACALPPQPQHISATKRVTQERLIEPQTGSKSVCERWSDEGTFDIKQAGIRGRIFWVAGSDDDGKSKLGLRNWATDISAQFPNDDFSPLVHQVLHVRWNWIIPIRRNQTFGLVLGVFSQLSCMSPLIPNIRRWPSSASTGGPCLHFSQQEQLCISQKLKNTVLSQIFVFPMGFVVYLFTYIAFYCNNVM